MSVSLGPKSFLYAFFALIVITSLLAMAAADSKPATVEEGLDLYVNERSEQGLREGPVVLELFTSQGCSSCPPADEILSELSKDPSWKDKVIPLAFHVDYWNYLGWKDRFSDHRWTQRQGDYVEAMGGSTLYTPQAVVHGQADVVGSKFRQVKSAIAVQLKNKKSHQVAIQFVDVDVELDALRGRIKLSGHVPATSSPYFVVGAVYETGLSTPIGRGENAGRTLSNDYVVRELSVLAELSGGEETAADLSFDIVLKQPFDRSERAGVAVFVQHSETMEIIGAASWNVF